MNCCNDFGKCTQGQDIEPEPVKTRPRFKRLVTANSDGSDAGYRAPRWYDEPKSLRPLWFVVVAAAIGYGLYRHFS